MGFKKICAERLVQPIIIGQLDTPRYIEAVTVVQNTAFIANGDSGLQIVDVSNPYNATVVGSLETYGCANKVAVEDNIAFVANGIGGIQMIDIADHANPIKIGLVDTPGYAVDVFLVDKMAYVADGNGGIQIIDVSSPSIPGLIGSLETPGDFVAFTIDGNKVFAADGEKGIQIIDVKNPFNPFIIGSVDTPGSASGIAVKDNFVFVADGGSGLQVIDISDPVNPIIICSYNPGNWKYANDINVLNSIVVLQVSVQNEDFTYAEDETLQILNVSDPCYPFITGCLVDKAGAWVGQSITVVENFVFTVGWAGLKVIDISNIYDPTVIGLLDISNATEIAVAGNKAFVASGNLEIIDVSEPHRPLLISSLDILASDVTIVENKAYVAGGNSVHVIDVVDPRNPIISGYLYAPGIVTEVSMFGEIPVVKDSYRDLAILYGYSDVELFDLINDDCINVSLQSPEIPGNYTICVYDDLHRDELIGALTFLEPGEYYPQSRKKAIIISGRNGIIDPLWEYTRKNANYAYNTLLHRGYTHDNILYLSPENLDANGDGASDVDHDATLANLTHAFDTWVTDTAAPAFGLVVYMIGHGATAHFRINSKEMVSAIDITDWLSAVESHLEGNLVFIYDGCLSGSFLNYLTPSMGKNSIVMTSASQGEPANFLDGGERSFSYRFWYDIYEGYKIGYAFARAKAEMSPHRQHALIYNETLAYDAYIGVDKVIAPIGPRITRLSPESLRLNGEISVTFEIDVQSENGIKYVNASIITPAISQRPPDKPVINSPEIMLTDSDGDGTYQGVYNGFTEPGTYTITISVEDKLNLRAYNPDKVITITQTAGILPGDINGDSNVDLADVITALQTVAGIKIAGIQMAADPNGDERIGVVDALILLREISSF